MACADRAGVPGGDCLCRSRAALPERRRRSVLSAWLFERSGWARRSCGTRWPSGSPAYRSRLRTGAVGWHDEQLLLAELTLAIVWWVGSRGASSSANLRIGVALIVAIWLRVTL